MDSDGSRPLVHPRQDLTRVTLAVLFIGSLLVASFWVMQPFLPAIVWATTLVLATWPLMLWLQRHTGNRRGLAVLIMTLTLLLLVIVPFWLALSTVITNIDKVGDLVRTILSLRPPPPPSWLDGSTPGRSTRRRGMGKTELGRRSGTGPKTDPLRRNADLLVRVRYRKSGRHVHTFPADNRDSRGDVFGR